MASAIDPHPHVTAWAGTGRCRVSLTMLDTGRGWVGVLTGGDSPHLGGVALAVPRPSLRGAGRGSCDLFSVPVPGHLDNEAALPVAKALCLALGSAVSLSSGIHIDGARPEELSAVSRNCLAAAEKLIAGRRQVSGVGRFAC